MIEFLLLGPLEVVSRSEPLNLGGRKQRMVLAMLLLETGRVVPRDRLIDAIWGEEPPPTAVAALQNAISQLRKLLGAETLVTRPPGYLLRIEEAQLDLARCRRLVEQARPAAPARRVELLRQALDLWRGPALAEFEHEPFARAEIARLAEWKASILEQRFEAELLIGGHAGVVGELEALVHDNPLHEGLRTQLMLALYRSGRQADALDHYQQARRILVDELGIEPSPPLQRLQASILRQELAVEGNRESEPIDDEQVAEIAEAFQAGRVMPVIGADHRALAEALAGRFGLEDGGDLTRVSQYVDVMRGSGPLYDELHALLESTAPVTALHRFLASLPSLARARETQQPVLVSASYDLAIEQALLDAGEEFDVVTYLATGPHRGRFCHLRPDGRATPIESPNTYMTELSLEERPVVLKLHGRIDLDPQRRWESFVVTEDDYIAFLALPDMAAALPVALAARIRRSHFLFLDYEMSGWHLRGVLARLWTEGELRYRSWAVTEHLTPLERELWRRRGVEALEAAPTTIAERLAHAVDLGEAKQ